MPKGNEIIFRVLEKAGYDHEFYNQSGCYSYVNQQHWHSMTGAGSGNMPPRTLLERISSRHIPILSDQKIHQS